MPLPTLYSKGILNSYNPDVRKEDLDQFEGIHFLMALLAYKLAKKNVNIHDRLLMFKSETGTGKSTAFVVETYRRFFGEYTAFPARQKAQVAGYREPIAFDFGVYDFPDDEWTITNRKAGIPNYPRTKNTVYCTQPKVLTAKGKAEEISSSEYNPDLVLSENVGFTTGNFKAHTTAPNSIMFATLGSFKTMIQNNTAADVCAKFAIVMIDECHILQKELEMSIQAVRTFVRENAGNPNTPLFIFMSATFDIAKYAAYLGTPKENSIFAKGSESKITHHFLEEDSADLIGDTVKKVWELHTANLGDKPTEADILVFVPDLSIGGKMILLLEKMDTKGELIIYTLAGEIVNKGGREVEKIEVMALEEVRKLEGKPNAVRRVTFTTSVAETGITIMALKYVIDCGFNKCSEYSATYDTQILLTKNVVKSAKEQRDGRVGRNFPGNAYAMYTRATYEQLPEYEYSDTYRSDITQEFMSIMYRAVPVDHLREPMNSTEFVKFCESCKDPDALRPTTDNNLCHNVYINSMVRESQIISVRPEENGGIDFVDEPPEMLNPLPQDSVILARSKMISLGLYATFAGLLASKMIRCTVEQARMLLTCVAYGVSLNDACSIAILSEKNKTFQVDPFVAKRNKLKGFYDRNAISKAVIKPANIKKYYFGDIRKFHDMVECDFIEGLLTYHYLASLVDKPTLSMKAFYEQLEKSGLKRVDIMYLLTDRFEIIETCERLGLRNDHPDIDFNAPNVIDHIARIKKLLWSGYKRNQAWHVRKSFYRTAAGMEIQAQFRTNLKPKMIIYNGISMREDSGGINYTATATMKSAMDGWL